MGNQLELKLKLNHLRQLWFDFSEKHTELYEITCDEYMHLLASEIDELEANIDEKTKVLGYINQLEVQRNELTNEITNHYGAEKQTKLSGFLKVLNENNEETISGEINKLNLILLDIVEKIQEQNRKNQFFLNKAIMSLKELKESFNGKPAYKTYSSSGMTKGPY